MQIIIGIVIGIAISFGTIMIFRLIGWIKLRILENQLERLAEQTQPIYGYPGRRYKEDGSYTGGKTTFYTDWALQKVRELSERSEKETDLSEKSKLDIMYHS